MQGTTLQGSTLLSRYQIRSKLGSGGFGETYLGTDLALPGHPPCVVKHLCSKEQKPEICEIAQTLFEREAQILYRLSQQDTFPALYAHFEQNQNFFLVQEYIPGHDIAEELTADNPLPEAQTRELLLDILTGLEHLHQQNIIHRDLKPPNLRRRQSDGRIILIDFGAVKDIRHLTLTSAGETSVSVVVGSPGYMPAEQVAGKPKLASDIYAVGMIGIQAVTGVPPTQLPENTATGELLWRDRTQVSPDFAALLDQMVHPYHPHRFVDATAAITALKALPPVSASGKKTPSRLPLPFSSAQTDANPTSIPTTLNRATLNRLRWRSPKLWIAGAIAVLGLTGAGVLIVPGVAQFIGGLTQAPRVSIVSPVAFVENYYDGINRRKFSSTWKKLSPDQQERGGGWRAYLEWWSKVEAVYFEDIQLAEQTRDRATVQMKLWYVMKDGEARPEVKNQIELIWDDDTYGWLIDRVSLAEETE